MQEFDKAYNDYFGISNDYCEVIDGNEESEPSLLTSRPRMTAKGNIDDIDKLGEILRRLLNTAWGSSWGSLSPDSNSGENAEVLTSPKINYSINLREVSKGTSPKPTLMDTISEEIDGVKTGEAIRVYRQSFDCIVEFNFLCSTSKDCRKLMNDFEELIITYSGYLKEQGLSEIFFLKEVPPKYSLSFNEKCPMKCCYYFVKLERNRTIKVSKINEIEMKLRAEYRE